MGPIPCVRHSPDGSETIGVNMSELIQTVLIYALPVIFAITLHEVASAAGISPRGLQLAFREYRGTTPLGFWRDARLARAHADLLDAAPGTKVTDIALRWGFTHFGRFSALYRARFGLSPRDTLKG